MNHGWTTTTRNARSAQTIYGTLHNSPNGFPEGQMMAVTTSACDVTSSTGSPNPPHRNRSSDRPPAASSAASFGAPARETSDDYPAPLGCPQHLEIVGDDKVVGEHDELRAGVIYLRVVADVELGATEIDV